MTHLALSVSAILPDRTRAVRRSISPLLPAIAKFSFLQIGFRRDSLNLCLVPFGRAATSYLNPEEPLLPMRIGGYNLNYYETWLKMGNTDEHKLDRLYLHIHQVKGTSKLQIFSLHCDPSIKQSEFHYEYKRGPHFHIEGATPDISRAHIALCANDVSGGSATIEEITKSFANAIKMVSKELLPCWERA